MSELTILERIKLAREGGQVRRHHAAPVIKDQDVAQHTFNMLTMLFILHPAPSMKLVRAITAHDVAERLIGDIAHPVKATPLIDRQAMKIYEKSINELVFEIDDYILLTGEELKWLAGLDMLEYYCFCLDQMMYGNRHFDHKIKYVDDLIYSMRGEMPAELVDAFYEIRNTWPPVDDQMVRDL